MQNLRECVHSAFIGLIKDSFRHLVGFFLSGTSFTQSVAKTTAQILEVPHPSRSLRLATLGLSGPVEASGLGRRIAALGALRFLQMVRRVAAPATDGVRLVVTLSKTSGSLGHLSSMRFWPKWPNDILDKFRSQRKFCSEELCQAERNVLLMIL